ncbi:MAG: hypothetical protein PVH52_05495, partial [bacterium]
MSKERRVILLAICLTSLGFLLSSGGALADTYTEDFTSKQYCDVSNTTALWDTSAGDIRLHPFQFSLAGNYDTPGNASKVDISGDYAYVADYSSLQIIDISDPTIPVFASSYDPPGLTEDVIISGDYAYVATYASGL